MVCPMTAIGNFSDGYWWRSKMNILDSLLKTLSIVLIFIRKG